ncbi:MAG: HAD-IIB family hydrolase [Eubacterium sp.]|nr:HAD-IIB family hydrolase [Eubacterium sp.]
MGKFDGYLICADCDGTLTYEAGKISKENIDAINHFQEEGGLFTLATGRLPGFSENFTDVIDINAPAVTLGGTLLYDLKKDEIVKNWLGSKYDAMDIIKHVAEHWSGVRECWANYNISESVSYSFERHKLGDGYLEELFEPLPDQIYKSLLFVPKEIIHNVQKDLTDTFGDKFRFDMSWNEGLEMQVKTSSKGLAVKYLKEHLGGIHTTVGVGDYENDISLMEETDIGYAVANAPEHVKAHADRITVANTDHAIAAIINDLEGEI